MLSCYARCCEFLFDQSLQLRKTNEYSSTRPTTMKHHRYSETQKNINHHFWHVRGYDSVLVIHIYLGTGFVLLEVAVVNETTVIGCSVAYLIRARGVNREVGGYYSATYTYVRAFLGKNDGCTSLVCGNTTQRNLQLHSSSGRCGACNSSPVGSLSGASPALPHPALPCQQFNRCNVFRCSLDAPPGRAAPANGLGRAYLGRGNCVNSAHLGFAEGRFAKGRCAKGGFAKGGFAESALCTVPDRGVPLRVCGSSVVFRGGPAHAVESPPPRKNCAVGRTVQQRQ